MKRLAIIAALLLFSMPAFAFLYCDADNTNAVFWYVGQPTDPIRAVGWDTGVECFATGPELAYLRANFTGIKGRVKPAVGTFWTGDDAQFIVDNL